MCDLRIMYPIRRVGAVEVVTATDPASTELARLINRQSGPRWQADNIHGGWIVDVSPTAPAKRVLRDLPSFLERLEVEGRSSFHSQAAPIDLLTQLAAELGVNAAWQSATDFPGSIYTQVDEPSELVAGYVDASSDGLVAWVSEFVGHASLQDVIEKLASAESGERHVFVIIPVFGTAPFAAIDPLLRRGAATPSDEPLLPPPVTHVWVAHAFSRQVFCWSPSTQWSVYRVPPTDK